ncbi:MAG: PEP-CTERM sorting domain-containing protein [Thermoguttaceae bacterium]
MTSSTQKHRLPRLGFLWRRTLADAAAILLMPAIFLGASRLDAAGPTCVPAVATAGTVTPSSSSSPPAAAYTPSQIQTAYGINAISLGSTTGNGLGQTIAIIDAYNDPNIIANVNSFSSKFNLQQFNVSGGPTLSVLNEYGNAIPNQTTSPTGTGEPPNAPAGVSSWSIEESLDVEWAHAIAPKANIILYEANVITSGGSSFADLGDLLTAVQTAAGHSGVSVVSMSWGTNEFPGETSVDPYFTTPAGHPKVTFVASTGDSSAPGEYPAYSPNVVAVGGTTLKLNSNNTRKSEIAWGNGIAGAEGGGGGGSNPATGDETEPSYQVNANIPDPTGMRETPDISFDADPNTGVPIDDSYDLGSSTPWAQYGGTSLAAPCIASLLAISDQFRTAEGLSLLDGPEDLYSLPATDFNDITSGGNGNPAGPGYDMATGIGTPIANLLVPALGEMNDASPAPEPGTLALLAAAGLAATAIFFRRRR